MGERPDNRTCTKCGETKPLELFRKANNCKSGYSGTCLTCANARCRQRPKHPTDTEADATILRTCTVCGEEKLLGEFNRVPSCRLGRGTTCRPCVTAKAKAWREANPERYRTLMRNHHRKLRAEQPDAEAARTFQSDARKRGAEIIELVVPLVVLERDDGVCGICGEDVDPFDFTLDHIVGVRDGGEHSYANVQVAHDACNIRKGVKERDARKMAVA